MINTDIPIQKSKDDLLNRSEFAEQLAKAILEYKQDESFNIGLYGKWGSGKTSIINMVEEKLNESGEEKKRLVLRFNPWLFSNSTQLVQQFFRQLAGVIGESSSDTNQKISKGLEIFGTLVSVVPGASPIGALVSLFGKVIGDHQKENLQKMKDEIIEDLKQAEFKLVIIIDDIDRLSDNEIRVIFQLIKSVADFPNTIYLLAFDDEVVSKALDKFQDGKGKEYLEKIIQIPIVLPQIHDEQLSRLFLNKLEKIIGDIPEDKWDKTHWSNLYAYAIKPLLSNLRDVNRLNNTIAFKFSPLRHEVYIINFIALTVIEVFAPQLYRQIPIYKSKFCGAFSNYSTDDKNKKEVKEIVEKILLEIEDDKKRASIYEVLKWTFPKIKSVDGNNFLGGNYTDYSESVLKGCIYNEHHFDKYFSLYIKESLSLKEVEYIIFESTKEILEEKILEINQKYQVKHFLEHVTQVAIKFRNNKLKEDRINFLLYGLIKNKGDFIDPEMNSMTFDTVEINYQRVIRFLLFALPTKEKRFESIKNIFINTNISLSEKMKVLLNLEQDVGRYIIPAPETTEEKETILSVQQVQKLEEICKGLTIGAINQNQLIEETNFLIIRYFQEFENKFIDDIVFTKYINSLKKDDRLMAKLLLSFVRHGSSDGEKTWDISKKRIHEYFVVDKVYKQMKKWMLTKESLALFQKEREDIVAFLYFVDNEKNSDFLLGSGVTLSNIKKYAEENKIKLDD